MKNYFIHIVSIFAMTMLTYASEPQDNSPLYLGTQTLYSYDNTKLTPPPHGYEVFYINHLGRHGARYLTSDEKINELIDTLEQAGKKGVLLKEGNDLLNKLTELSRCEYGFYGLLSKQGVAMEKGIAHRMWQNNAPVFDKPIKAVSTYVTRTKQSMHAFVSELEHHVPKHQIETASYGKIDPILRFFDLNIAYLKYKKMGSWHRELAQYRQRSTIYTNIADRLFHPNASLTQEDKLSFAAKLYSVYSNQYDVGCDVGLKNFFQENELEYLWENRNAMIYLEKGPSNIGQDLPTNISFGLLMDFLDTSEKAILTRKIGANLRFAHAETIIPFASLLKLKFADQQTNDLKEIKKIWQDDMVAPMAANIQWIFYANAQNDILMKCLYNEKEVELPISSTLKPYYSWNAVSKYYGRILAELKLRHYRNLVEDVMYYRVR